MKIEAEFIMNWLGVAAGVIIVTLLIVTCLLDTRVPF